MGLNVHDISVELGGKQILDAVSVDIRQGELFSLLGPSGCGKTTLLKIVAGLLAQDSGTISLDGRRLDDLPPEKRDMAVVFQEMRLFPNMSVVENVAFPLKMRKVKKAERMEAASEMLERVQLAGFERRRVSQLSGGQAQRVALARAIVARPKLLLLDEPFSALDENLRDDMRDLLADLHAQMQITTILVTHDQAEALRLSDRVAVMDAGRLLQCADPQTVYDAPANLQIAHYLSDARAVRGCCENGRFTCPAFQMSCTLGDGPAVAMVRHCALSLSDEGSGLDFTVRKTDFLGDRKRLSVERAGVELDFESTNADSTAQGEHVFVRIDFDKVLVFPDDGQMGGDEGRAQAAEESSR